MATNYKCPVCGYPELSEPSYDDFDCPSHEICPSCGTEFGYDDAAKDVSLRQAKWRSLREKWVSSGMKWFSRYDPIPNGWDPMKQVASVS